MKALDGVINNLTKRPFGDVHFYNRESNNENPNGQSGIAGFMSEKEEVPFDHLRHLYEAKKAIQEQHEIQLLNDVKRLKKFKGYRRKIVQVDIKKWMDKTDKEIVETVKNLL